MKCQTKTSVFFTSSFFWLHCFDKKHFVVFFLVDVSEVEQVMLHLWTI